MWAFGLKKTHLVVQGTGFEPVKHKAADLQSAGFNHSPTPARNKKFKNFLRKIILLKHNSWSPRGDSNPRPADYKSAALAN